MSEAGNGTDDNFGAIIKRERNKQGLSLQKLTVKTGNTITPSYINRLEAGEKINPSFGVVCSLATALSLDLREVFKVFGYENLLNINTKSSSDTIEELIRLNNVEAPKPSSQREIEIAHKNYLSQEEKEQLIEIITSIFQFSIAKPEKALGHMPLIIEQIVEFRETRQEKLQEKKTGHIDNRYN